MTKFAYLKELVDPKVRAEIDGLPFTTEGYERAKNILIGEYGKTNEIVNVYVQKITNLQEARVQCAIFEDTRQIERGKWKCKECARQTKGCKSRSSKRTNRLAGLGIPTVDKSFENLEGN